MHSARILLRETHACYRERLQWLEKIAVAVKRAAIFHKFKGQLLYYLVPVSIKNREHLWAKTREESGL